jgi:hypothetical protein
LRSSAIPSKNLYSNMLIFTKDYWVWDMGTVRGHFNWCTTEDAPDFLHLPTPAQCQTTVFPLGLPTVHPVTPCNSQQIFKRLSGQLFSHSTLHFTPSMTKLA